MSCNSQVFDHSTLQVADETSYSRHAGKHSDTTKSYKVDVEKHEEANKYFSITQTPTFVIYKDGKEVKRIEGDEGPKMKELVEFLSS